jgi:hypothetical protein
MEIAGKRTGNGRNGEMPPRREVDEADSIER